MDKEFIVDKIKNGNINILTDEYKTLNVDFYEAEIYDRDIFSGKYKELCTLRECDIDLSIVGTGVGKEGKESLAYVYQLTKDQLGLFVISMFRNEIGQCFTNNIYNATVMI